MSELEFLREIRILGWFTVGVGCCCLLVLVSLGFGWLPL